MSKRSYTACFLHIIWGTHKRLPLLNTNENRGKLTEFIKEYLREKNILLKELFINPDHVHMLIELPTNMTIQDIVKLIKGSSSHWINQNNITKAKFSWATGYGAFTVSQSNIENVKRYIQNQKEHHRKTTFGEEYKKFIRVHGLKIEE